MPAELTTAVIAGIMIATGQWYALALLAVSVAGSLVAYQSAKRGRNDSLNNNGFLENTQSSSESVPILYGRYRLGGNRVYVSSTGGNHETLHIVLTLSEGPIDAIETIYLDDKTAYPTDQFNGRVAWEFFSGAGTQGVCATLNAYDAAWNDYMRWTGYLYLRLTYDPTLFTGVPKINVVARGRQLYDPRNGVTAYSNNPALVWYDFVTNKRYGLGIDTALINVQSVIDAANWCESQYAITTVWAASTAYAAGNRRAPTGNKKYHFECVTAGTSGVSEPVWPTTPGATITDGSVVWKACENTYTFNGVIADRKAFLDNHADLLNNFRGAVIWSEGQYKLLIKKYDAPVMSLTEADIVADSFTFTVPGLADTPNRVKIKYPDSAGDWIAKDLYIEDSAAVLQYDLEERDAELPLIGTTNAVQANLLGVYNLERLRLNKAYTLTAHPKTLVLEPGDMVQITHTLPGWVKRMVRVIDVHLAQDGLVALTVQEEDSTLYDAILNLSPHTYFQTNLPDPLAPVAGATGVSFLEEEYFNKDVSYTRLVVTYTPPTSPFWKHSEVWVNVNNAGYTHYSNSRGTFTIEPVKEGVAYKVKLISISDRDIKQDFATATEWVYSVVGKNTPPGDVANFKALPQSDTIILMWDAVNAVDLQGYEIRRGTNWNGGIFIGFTRAVSFHLNGVAPGTHSFMIRSVDTNGKYSSNFALATATVYGPASYTEKMSEAIDFTSPAAWVASTAYVLGNKVTPATPNGYYYKCATAGTSGATTPAWATSNGTPVTDGTVVWTCYQDQVFTNTERYVDAIAGAELRAIHGGDEFVSTQDLKTGGDGAKLAGWSVLNIANAALADTNTTNIGELTIKTGAANTVFNNTTFSGPYVYKAVSGDFDIETRITSNHVQNSEMCGLLVRDPAASIGEDWLGLLVGFDAGANNAYAKNTANNVTSSTAFAANQDMYQRITRVGNVFTLYSKASAGAAWTQRAQYTRADFAASVQVGLGMQSGNIAGVYISRFDYFRRVNGNLVGTYTSPTYGRGSTVTRRSWLVYDYLFEGTGAAWYDQFTGSALWTSKFATGDTWLKLFGAYAAGTLKLSLGTSIDGTTWTWTPNFESFTVEMQANYVKYALTITDVDPGGYLHLKANTFKEAYFV